MAGGRNKKKKDHNRSGIPKNDKTRAKYDLFVLAYIENGKNGAAAAIAAGYAEKSARQTATKLLTNAYIQEQIKIKQKELEENYTVTMKNRINMLEDVFKEAMRQHFDAFGNRRSLALPSAVAVVAEMNKMLGTTAPDEEAQPLTINFNIAEPKAEMTVTNAAPA